MQKKHQAGSSKLVYKTQFQWSFLKPAYWGSWLSVIFLFVLFILPDRLVCFISDVLAEIALKVNKKRYRIAEINIRLCFPGLTEAEQKAMIKEHFRAQMRSVLHYGMIWWSPRGSLEKRIVIKGQENIEASLKAGRSVIIMTSHSVALEMAVTAITMRYPISGPFKVLKNPVSNWLIAKGRTRFGTIIYSREAGLRPIIKDVKAGQLMFYLPDEDLGRDRSIFVPMFNIQKATVPVLGRLARSCNADVLPCISCYDKDTAKYNVYVMPAMKGYPQGDDEKDARTMNMAIEETVKICPPQYFWTLRLFRTRPEGEDRFY
ncbi:MAG: lipid A biosynthesis acyltransferase [Gammaproteobacteria bacterium]|nr:lipid A biosynthesis acyltransferase [Gammaproteobacteria bacterium]